MRTNLNLVAASMGMSIVPASMQGLQARAVVHRPLLESAKSDAPLTLAYRAEDSAGPVASFVGLTRKAAAKFLRCVA